MQLYDGTKMRVFRQAWLESSCLVYRFRNVLVSMAREGERVGERDEE